MALIYQFFLRSLFLRSRSDAVLHCYMPFICSGLVPSNFACALLFYSPALLHGMGFDRGINLICIQFFTDVYD
jgi:hypothetical protein